MRKYSLLVVMFLSVSCSDYRGSEWSPGNPIYPASTPGRVHGDERSQTQRYQDCLSSSRKAESKAERSRCSARSHYPDPDYVGVSFPLQF